MADSLYMAVRSRRRQTKSELHYGISVGPWTSFNKSHLINTLLKNRSLRLFIGIVRSQAVTGCEAAHYHRKISISVYLAESVLPFCSSYRTSRTSAAPCISGKAVTSFASRPTIVKLEAGQA